MGLVSTTKSQCSIVRPCVFESIENIFWSNPSGTMILFNKFLPEFGRAKWAHVILLMGLVVSLRVFMEANARPLSEWERFKSESSMTAYLNRLVGTYIDPSIFHLSIHIQGDINSEAQGKSPRQQGVVRGKETDPGADEDDMEMLPALPFYNRRIQKTKEIRAEQSNLFPEDQSTLQVTTQSGSYINQQNNGEFAVR